jgi:mono/diheme cytochrome c family protein
MKGVVLAAAAAGVLLVACERPQLSPEAERGRQVYVSQCTTCHAFDPAQPGPVGPELKGASREVVESKVVRGNYPPDYQPKRPTAVMPPQPQLSGDVDALATYLKN